MNRQIIVEKLIEPALRKCHEYLQCGNDGTLYYVDPNDNVEISAHYGVTHAATAFLIYGKEFDTTVYEQGKALITSILSHWEESSSLPAYHHDFNNFALCIAYDYIDESDLKESIKKIICNTSDSNHDTVNWLPMRWYVNEKRLEWTSDTKYKERCEVCRKKIIEATNSDGAIEDRLPKGVSFNLQYDISTVASLILLRHTGVEYDLSKEVGFLLKAILPDGDINYQGRGCNQIFAWGPWIYILSSIGLVEQLTYAVSYLSDGKLNQMLNHDNMMLNIYPGKAKYLWWDYHYASVYIAHFLFWLLLAIKDYGKYTVNPTLSAIVDSGFHVLNTHEVFVSWFDGRDEYLAEKGPTIAAIYTKKDGILFKGSFGPWQGLFGNRYAFQDVVIKNFIGLLGIELNADYSKSRILRKFQKSKQEKCQISPLFIPLTVEKGNGFLEIQWMSKKTHKAIFNAPMCFDKLDIELTANRKRIDLECVGRINNQYGERFLFQSHIAEASCWTFRIKL